MIVVTKSNLSLIQLKELASSLSEIDERINSLNYLGEQIFFLPENPSEEIRQTVSQLPGVESVHYPPINIQLSSKIWKKEPTKIMVDGVEIGGSELQIIAGPCAVESEDQMYAMAETLSNLGVKIIRGGAYKPRTSPYSFQGMETEGLKLIRKVADEYNLKVITEVVDRSVLDEVCRYADIVQIGARNMQNFFLLKELGRIDKPIFLKRGMSARILEWLGAAEYIISGGNPKVILCERGIRTFDTALRNTLDIAAIPLVKDLSHLPIFADPSHGVGTSKYIKPMALASVAAGAHGIMVESHPNPEKALSDGQQSLNFGELIDLVNSVRALSTSLKTILV